MSNQKSYSVPAASDEPVYEIDSFEMLWEQHKSKIIGGAIAFVAIVAGVFGYLIVTTSQRHAAESAFGSAKSPEEYQSVLQQFPTQPVAGSAALLYADALRGEKKYDEASQALDTFIKAQPQHPFAPLAKVAIAENLALAGKTADAEKALAAVSQVDPKSFAAPFALLLEAEMKSTQSNREGALAAYRILSKTYPDSIAARASAPAYQAIEALAPPAAKPAAP